MMLRAVASAARRAPSHAVAQSSLAMLPRALSTKVVAHCVGPDRVGVLKDITQTVLGLGAKITDARAVCLEGAREQLLAAREADAVGGAAPSRIQARPPLREQLVPGGDAWVQELRPVIVVEQEAV